MNDKMIFNYLNINDNDMLSCIDINELDYILKLINRYYLEYREILGLGSDITFGLEIEMEHFKGTVYDMWPFETNIYKIVGNNNWVVKNDITLEWGRELATEIYCDKKKTWIDIKNVCNYISMYGEIGKRSAGHINIGSQVLGNNSLYWYRFLKLWCVYENVIFRFGYGEYLNYFPFMLNSSRPISKLILDKLDVLKSKSNLSLKKMLFELQNKNESVDFLKKNAVSLIKMYDYDDFSYVQEGCVVEFRNCLGTMDEVIWQNNVNFFAKLMLYCKNDNFNDDILNRRLFDKGIIYNIDKYNKIYLDQALELCDLIFDNNLDKIYFLRQYLKLFEVNDEMYVRGKKLTYKEKCDRLY